MSRTSASASAARLISLSVLLCSTLAGCGGSAAPSKPVAQRVCDGAHTAAVAILGDAVSARVLQTNPANLECVLTAGRLHAQIVSQATARAFTEWNTDTSHQDQVFGPGVHTPGEIPVAVSGVGAVAVWIPAQSELVATDGTPTHDSGAYVTVTVKGKPRARRLPLARAVARATFAAHPDLAS